jgi:hypothetical protein
VAGKKKRGGKGSRRAPTVVTRWSRRFGRPLPDWPRLSSRRPSGRPQRGDSAWDKTLDHLLSLVDRTLNIGGSRPVLKRALSGGTGGQRRARPVEAARPAVLGDRRRGCSSMVEQQPSKLNTRVRFPSPAPSFSITYHVLCFPFGQARCCSFGQMSVFRSRGAPLLGAGGDLLRGALDVLGQHLDGGVPALCQDLVVGQLGIASFG